MTDQPWWEKDRTWLDPDVYRELVQVVRDSYPTVIIVSALNANLDAEWAEWDLKMGKTKPEHVTPVDLPEGYIEARARLRRHDSNGPGTEPF